jgi:hypothetical protein
MSTVAVDLARLQVGHERVPVVIRPVPVRIERDDACRLRRLCVVEEQQFDGCGALREHAEVHAIRRHCGAERRAAPRALIPGLHPLCPPGVTGFTFQMSRQYSRIDRSEEKRPTRAQLRIDIRVQFC